MRVAKFTKEINIADLTEKDIIGVQFDSGKRCFVSKISAGRFIGVSIELNSDVLGRKIEGETIQDFLRQIAGVETVYVFDSLEELKKWL